MRISKSVLISATATALTDVEVALSAGCDTNGDLPNAFNGGCISDKNCNTINGYRIYNHFYGESCANGTITLVPECRPITASPTPGFTCGTDTRLAIGTEVVLPNVPETEFAFDDRKVKLLRQEKYGSLAAGLNSQHLCSNEPGNYTCDFINQFSDGCNSPFNSTDGFTKFTDFFSVAGCEPKVTEHLEANGWVEEFKVFIGYDDLTWTLPGLQEVALDVHKVSLGSVLPCFTMVGSKVDDHGL